MGSTTQTALIGLPLFSDDDRPTWRGDINGAMTNIDAAFGADRGNIGDLNTQLSNIKPTNGKRAVGIDALTVSVDDHGAIGDGITDDTSAINSVISGAAPGTTIRFTYGKTYVISNSLILNNLTNVTFNGYGATIKMVGTGTSYAAFTPQGTVDTVTIEGFTINGSGVVADGHGGLGNTSGAEISNIRVINNNVNNTTLGISLNADLGGHIRGALIMGNRVSNIVGSVSGQGYGIHHASGDLTIPANVRIIGNEIINASRHSIYQAKGSGVVISNNVITDHRKTAAAGALAGAFLPAIMLARSHGVTATGNVVSNPWGGAFMIGGYDVGGASANYIFAHNTIIGSVDANPIGRIGHLDPATSATVTGAVVSGNTFDIGGGALGSNNATALFIDNGFNVNVKDNIFSYGLVSSSSTAIRLSGTGESAGTSTYTNNINVIGNMVNASGVSGTGLIVGIRLSGVETSAIKTVFRDNMLNISGTLGNSMFAQSVNLTNPNVTISRQSRTGLVVDNSNALVPENMGDIITNKFSMAGIAPAQRQVSPSAATGSDAATINAIITQLRAVGIFN